MGPMHCLCICPVCWNLVPQSPVPARVTQGSVSNRWGESGYHGPPTVSSIRKTFGIPTRSLAGYEFKEYEFMPWLELWVGCSLRLWTRRREKQDGVVEEQMILVRPTWSSPDSITCYLCGLKLCCWACPRLRSVTCKTLPQSCDSYTAQGSCLLCNKFPGKVLPLQEEL